MSYYHVFLNVKINGGKRQEFDLSKDDLLKFIVKPYLDAGKLFVSGSFINPFDIAVIEIFETGEKATKVHSEYKSSYSSVTGFRLLYPTTETAIRTLGKNRTGWFITHPPREEKKEVKSERKLRKNVFIVHGRDHKPMEELKEMLKGFGLKPIVLHEQPSGSRTIVEKLEKYSNVGYAFVILTTEDIGALAEDVLGTSMNKVTESTRPLTQVIEELFMTAHNKQMRFKLLELFSQFFTNRARQNVVLEFGYFIGLLGRDRVCCLYKGDIELPSDMHGIVYVPFKESVNEVKNKIIKELTEVGYQIKA